MKANKLKCPLIFDFKEPFVNGLENAMFVLFTKLEKFESEFLDELSFNVDVANESQNGGSFFFIILIIVLNKRYHQG